MANIMNVNDNGTTRGSKIERIEKRCFLVVPAEPSMSTAVEGFSVMEVCFLRTGRPPFFTINVAINMIAANTSELKNVSR